MQILFPPFAVRTHQGYRSLGRVLHGVKLAIEEPAFQVCPNRIRFPCEPVDINISIFNQQISVQGVNAPDLAQRPSAVLFIFIDWNHELMI